MGTNIKMRKSLGETTEKRKKLHLEKGRLRRAKRGNKPDDVIQIHRAAIKEAKRQHRLAARNTHKLHMKNKTLLWRNIVYKASNATRKKSMWEMVDMLEDTMKRPSFPLTNQVDGNTILLASDKEKAELLASKFVLANQRNEHSPPLSLSPSTSPHAPPQAVIDEPSNRPLTAHELDLALACCTRGTAPGEDGLHYEHLLELSPTGKRTLLAIFNSLYENGTCPAPWRKAVVSPIFKPTKDATQASSYRPISLTSCACKLFERLINRRLYQQIGQEGIAPQQFGFKTGHCASDNVVRLMQTAVNGFNAPRRNINKQTNLSKNTAFVTFDLTKAYEGGVEQTASLRG